MSRDAEIAAALRPVFAREAEALAGQIAEAGALGRRDELHALAHRLVGTAGTVHELDLVHASRRLEQLAAAPDTDAAALEAQVAAVLAAVRAAVGSSPIETASGELVAGQAGGARPVVVAIEDNPANVTLLRRIFEGLDGIELQTAETGRDGVRLALDRSAALVLLDMNLPDVSGEWVLETLRDDGGGAVPVVVVSADSGPEHERHARSLGAVDYVTKPFDVARLGTLVRRACGYADR